MTRFALLGVVVPLAMSGCARMDPYADLSFRATAGTQSDVAYERMDVFQDQPALDSFLTTVPSYRGPAPAFDASSETLVSIVLPREQCSSTPRVEKVQAQGMYGYSRVVVMITNLRDANAECDGTHTRDHVLHFIVFPKSDGNINLSIDNDIKPQDSDDDYS